MKPVNRFKLSLRFSPTSKMCWLLILLTLAQFTQNSSIFGAKEEELRKLAGACGNGSYILKSKLNLIYCLYQSSTGEGCDDGNSVSGDGCSSSCQIEAGWTCNLLVDPTKCYHCGDSNFETGEGCDDGNTTSGDGCSNVCQVEALWSCTATSPSVCTYNCGNGISNVGEICDDGNVTNGDGCSNTCTVEAGWSCAGFPSVCQKCGDGIIQGTETCDDNGCSSTCAIEAGWTCSGAPSVCQKCGDGIHQGTESCDDGNTTNTVSDPKLGFPTKIH